VDRSERDRDHEDDLVERAVGGDADDHQPAEQHDPVNRVRARHQRRVQRVRHLGDHDEADEAREHEDREVGRERAGKDHWAPPLKGSPAGVLGWLAAEAAPPAAAPLAPLFSTADFAPALTISPSRTTHAPAIISSSKSSFRAPSSPTSNSSSDSTLRANSCEECSGMLDGRFSGETIFTSCLTTVWPGSVSSQLPPVSPAMSMITEPGFIPSTASAVTSLGAGRPGTSAVVMTTSKPLIASVSACCCCARSSSV